jgi:hypothetical protein
VTAGEAVLFTVVLLALLGVWALVRRFQVAQDMFDTQTADEAEHVKRLNPPALTVVPDGFTCLRCLENPALPDGIWCAVCAPIVDSFPAEPIERGAL